MKFKTYDVVVKTAKVEAMRRKHPWVFSGALQIKEDIEEGSIIRLVSRKNEYLGTGYYQNSSISVRILDFDDQSIDQVFWSKKIELAVRLRSQLHLVNNPSTNCFRLINGEGDGIPGVIIDYYNGYAVIEIHASSFEVHIENLKNALLKNSVLEMKDIIIKKKYIALKEEGSLFVTVKENNIQFEIDLLHGQKTGFFLDQRDNRKLLGHYAEGKNVLNLFCYTGGFSLYALFNKAKHVHSIDVSKPAMEILGSNIKLNGFSEKNHSALTQDVKAYLPTINEEQFDLIIVDPPAFAKNLKKRHNAVQGYKRLNAQVMTFIKPGGIMFTFSCSQVVDSSLFEHTIRAAALEVGRDIKILHSLSQANDHPINLYHKEGRYLKGLVLYVS